MAAVKLLKNTTLTIRVNSTVKDALFAQAEKEGLTLTDYLTKLALRDLETSPLELTKLALGK